MADPQPYSAKIYSPKFGRSFRARDEQTSTLPNTGGGGTLPPVDVIDAKIAAAEARTDTKFAELRGDMAERFGRLDAELAKKPSTGALVGTAIAIVAVLLAALAFAANRFDAGVSAGGALAPYVTAQQQRDNAQDAKLDQILDRLPPAPLKKP